jgi:hypothetical protein
VSDELVEQLRQIVLDYAQHDSWRCAYPPHYYLVDPPEKGDCACGLLGRLRAVGIEPSSGSLPAPD